MQIKLPEANWRGMLSGLRSLLPRDYVSLALLGLVAVFLGYDIQSRPIVLWDESRVVSNALEMSRTGFSLVTTYDFKPDLWNTKPPLAIWIVAASIRLFGASEWAVRLPSFIAAMASVVITMKMTWWLTRKTWQVWLSAVLLVMSPGFFGAHAAQSADYDTILGLLVTCYLFCFFYIIHHQHNSLRWITAFGLFVVLACLTKGIAGLIPGVGIPFYLITQRRWSRVLAGRYFAVAAGAVVLIGAYYYFREQIDPGYIAAVQDSELGGRYLIAAKSHQQPPIYYVYILSVLSLSGPIALLSPVVMFIRWPVSRTRAFFTYGLFVVGFDVVVLTLSETKVFWYLVPIYPILAVTSTLLMGRMWAWLRSHAWVNLNSRKLVVAGVLATVVAVSFEVFAKAVDLMTVEYAAQGQYGRVFADLSKRGVSKVTVLDAGVDNAAGFINYSPQLHFYSVAWAGRGLSTQILHAVEPDKIKAGAVVVTCDPKLIDAVRPLGRPVAWVRDCAAVTWGPKAG